jgi:hypothetical protein
VRDAMKRLADDKMTDEDMALGLDWLLSDEQEVNTRELRVRAGGSDAAPVYLSWIIRAANTDEIRQAEREGEGVNRAQRRGGRSEAAEPDQVRANLRLICTATVTSTAAAGRAVERQGPSATRRCGCGSGSTTARA